MALARIGSFFVPLALAALVAHPARAATIAAEISPNPATEGQSVQLRLEIVGPLSMVVYDPTFSAPDFILLGSPGHAMPRHSNSEKTVRYTYVLQPKRSGSLSVRAIRVRTNMGELTTRDVTLRVEPGTIAPTQSSLLPADEDDASNPASPGYQPGQAASNAGGGGAATGGAVSLDQDFPKRFNSDFTVHAALSKRTAYVGEMIVAEYWLYDFGGIRQVEVQKWPSFTGFWRDDLEIISRFEFQDVYVGDQVARRAFLSRYALYGIKPGRLPLDRLIIRARYVSAALGGQFLGFGAQTGTHSSQEETLQILPLPTEGRPANFSGAVGNFSLRVEADKSAVAQHSPVLFSVTLRGIGNFQSLDSLRLPLPPDFEILDSAANTRGAVAIGVRRELESSKTFQFTAIPRKAGKFRVEPLAWSYFDPERKAYVTLHSDPIEIDVTESAAGQDTNSYLQPQAKGGAAGGVAEIRPLKAADGSASRALAQAPWMLIAALGSLDLWLATRAFRRKASNLLAQALEDRFAEARREWKEAARARDWLNPLESAIYETLAVPMGANPRGITRADLQASWREKGLPPKLIDQAVALLDKLDQQRFSANRNAPVDANKAKQKLLAEVEGLLRDSAKLKTKRK